MGRALRDKGGNILGIAELDANNALSGTLTNGTNCLNCKLLADSEVNIDPTVEKFKAEDGKTYGQDEEYEGNTRGTLMETSKVIADYLAFGVRGKTHLEYKYEGTKDAKHQEVFKLVDVTPQMHFKTPGGTKAMKYESVALVQDAAVTFSTGAIAALAAALGITIRTTAAVVIPAGQEHLLVETAV